MAKIVPILLAAAVTFSALAEKPMRFERDGIGYVADVSWRNGARHIVGQEVDSHRRFDLTVKGNRVTGSYDGSPVAYRLPPGSRIASR